MVTIGGPRTNIMTTIQTQNTQGLTKTLRKWKKHPLTLPNSSGLRLRFPQQVVLPAGGIGEEPT